VPVPKYLRSLQKLEEVNYWRSRSACT
jgi:hypothetical protein